VHGAINTVSEDSVVRLTQRADPARQHEPSRSLGGVHADGRVFGRGASDMKSGLAAMLAGMTALSSAEVALPGVVVFAGVVGEEVDCCGSRHFPAENGMKDVGWLVVAKPTNPDLVVAHKGALRVELTTSGRAAHGSTPNIGVNTILHMVELLQRLTSLEQPHTHIPCFPQQR
jgi:succinyl-diaminopimelate desuccinylase